MEYYVYKHTLFDGRTYIGITKQNPPQKRWQNGTAYKGNTYFTRTIEKYGWENFDHEILASKLSEEEAKKLEIELIKKYKSNQRKYGFNISSGGESKSGTTISEEQKEKIRKANIGKVVSTETRKKLSVTSKVRWSNPLYVEHMRKINLGENNPRYGKKMSDEEKRKRKAKGVIQLDMNGNKIDEFVSTHQASEKTGVHRQDISKCCKGIFKQAGGFIWQFSEQQKSKAVTV